MFQCPRYECDGGAEGSVCTLRMRWKDTGFSVHAMNMMEEQRVQCAHKECDRKTQGSVSTL
jgi:hypothetical protein